VPQSGPGLALLTFESAEVGTDLGSLDYMLTEEKLNLFRRACGDPGARYPTIATKDFYYLLQNRFAVGLMLHAKHESNYVEPPALGQRLTVTGRVVDRYVRRGRGFVVVESVTTGEAGKTVVRSRTTFLPLDGQAELPANQPDRVDPPPVKVRRVGIAGHEPGTTTEPMRRQLTSEGMVAWERCSETVVGRPPRESIHINAGLAEDAGQSAPVASGMHTVAHLGHLLRELLGDAWTYGGHLAVRHVRALHAGDELVARARVTGVYGTDGEERLLLDAWCEDARGNPSTVGTADAPVSRLG
jgi:acyl dehydratase